MDVRWSGPEEIEAWMTLTEEVRAYFPGLETEEGMRAHRRALRYGFSGCAKQMPPLSCGGNADSGGAGGDRTGRGHGDDSPGRRAGRAGGTNPVSKNGF